MKFETHSMSAEEFGDYCRSHGLAATHQRITIFQELAATQKHPDTETIYRGVRTKLPSISLDTVYRTLRTFEENGMIMRVTTTGERARYDADTNQHPHFICQKCGMVADLHELDISGLQPQSIPAQTIGSVASVCIELRGICKNCQKGNHK